MGRIVVAFVLGLALLGQSEAAWAQSAPRGSGVAQASYSVGSVLTSVIYTPLKGLLCLLGGASSGLVYLSSGAEAQKAVAGASCKGTWVITPDVLRGKEPFTPVSEIP